MPYEQISEDVYHTVAKGIKDIELSKKLKDAQKTMDDPSAENF